MDSLKNSFNKKIVIDSDSEADTCRKQVTPKLYQSGWTDDQILEQRTFTAGKIIVLGRKAKRKKAKRADYILRYTSNFPIAVVEAKNKYKTASEGIQQAKEYAEILGLAFAFATNGEEIIEFDFTTGIERKINTFPSPEELWNRYNEKYSINEDIEQTFLKPFYPIPRKEIRYYQGIAINKAVKAILENKKRLLLTLATGTGKTTIAFQVIYKLWSNRWNTKNAYRRPKILFLADRNILISDPHSKDFSVLGDARCLLPEEGIVTSREVYFSTYQYLAENSERPGLFREFPRDFFDLIVIDECHRGSASDDSNWRMILEYFSPAVQLGLTATPLREDNKDTYAYFGNPLYTYTLKQGIEDGFLAPYNVHRVVTSVDATGWRPEENQYDSKGQLIPDGIYTTPDFENTLSFLPRTKAVAKHLYEYMKENGRFEKTIVFCVDQEHANDFRREIANLNKDIVKDYPNYAVRVVSDEGSIGKGYLSNFMDIDNDMPVIVTTSKLLSTGVDIPTCKNIAIFRDVNTMTEFKQIIGRGTRVREDKDKLFFTILDYTGSASRKFADSEFDGEPPLITNEEINDDGETVEGTYEEFPKYQYESDEDDIDEDENEDEDFDPKKRKKTKYYVEEGTVTISAESVQILDQNGNLKTTKYSHYAKEQIITLFPNAEELKNNWINIQTREMIIQSLEDNGIFFDQLVKITGKTDVDVFDLLCYVAYDLKPLTRKQRVEKLKKNANDYFQEYSESARDILNLILDKYIDYGIHQIRPDIISVEPISQKGNALEIVNIFGGIEKFRKAIDDLHTLLYAS